MSSVQSPVNGATQHTRPAREQQHHHRIALVGLGHRGYKTHFLNTIGSRSESIIAVCDANATTLSSFSAKHKDVPAYPSLELLIRHHKPAFAIVCVPHKAHAACILQLAEAGIAVLKEKPAAKNLEDYDAQLRLPIKIGVTFQKRFEPRYYQLQKLLPLLGKVASFRATLARSIQDLESTWRAADGVGVTEDLGCHMLDIITSLFGLPTTLTAQKVNSVREFQEYGGDDVSNVSMQWNDSGIIGHVHMSRVSNASEESVFITGTGGSLHMVDEKVVLQDASGAQIFEMTDTSSKKTVVRGMLRSFGDYVVGRTNDFRSSLSHLGDTVKVIDATLKSFESGETENLVVTTKRPKDAAATAAASWEGDHFVWPLITPEMEKAVVNQMHSSLSIYDRSNVYEAFEDRWRHMHGLKHALVCNSGTIAILHMFEALGLQPGDEVLCPVYTFFATATPMLQYGAVPIFCDSLADGNLDPAEIARKATSKTKAVIVTHMWGLPCQMSAIITAARKVNDGAGIKVLEDCSHAHGAAVDGRLVGTWGDMAAWSLQAKKNITGGQAGIFATNNTSFYAQAVTHGHFNKRAKQEVPQDHGLRKFWLTGLGLNLRAHPLAIAMALCQLNAMPSYMECREKYAQFMSSELSKIPFLKMPKVRDGRADRHAWYAFVMQFSPEDAPTGLTREKFVAALVKKGLKEVDVPKSTGLLNNLPIFTQAHEAFPRFGKQRWARPQPEKDFPTAKVFYDRAIKLPVWATAGDWPIVKRYVVTFLSVAQEQIGPDDQGIAYEEDSPGFKQWRQQWRRRPVADNMVMAKL